MLLQNILFRIFYMVQFTCYKFTRRSNITHMKNVSIYSTPTCVYCNLAKTFFKTNNIAYTEYNVASDLDKRKEMIDKTGQMGVPVIIIGEEVVVGFDEGHVKSLLGV